MPPIIQTQNVHQEIHQNIQIDRHTPHLEPHLHKPHLEQTPASPVSPSLSPSVSVCGTCAEFLALDRSPYKGNCLLHAVPISSWDKACSQYYQDEPFQSVGSDDEF